MSLVTRSQIVAAAVAAVDGKLTKGNLRPWKVIKIQDKELPAICLYVDSTPETSPSLSKRNRTDRTDTLVIDIHVKSVDDTWIDESDTIFEEMKRGLLNDSAFLALSQAAPSITSDLRFSEMSDHIRAITSMRINVEQTADYEPLVAADVDLETVNIESTHNESGQPLTEITRAEGLDL